MIQEYRNLTPFIDLGFGLESGKAAINEVITVWLSTIYDDEYSSNISYNATKASLVKVSDYEYQLTFTEPGEYEVFIVVSDMSKTLNFKSNTITLTVE